MEHWTENAPQPWTNTGEEVAERVCLFLKAPKHKRACAGLDELNTMEESICLHELKVEAKCKKKKKTYCNSSESSHEHLKTSCFREKMKGGRGGHQSARGPFEQMYTQKLPVVLQQNKQKKKCKVKTPCRARPAANSPPTSWTLVEEYENVWSREVSRESGLNVQTLRSCSWRFSAPSTQMWSWSHTAADAGWHHTRWTSSTFKSCDDDVTENKAGLLDEGPSLWQS